MRCWKEIFWNANLCCLFDGCWFHLFSVNAQPIPAPAPGAQREQLQTSHPWDGIQVPTAPYSTFATSLEPQISILAHADWRSRTSLVLGAATGLASITTKHNHNNRIHIPSYRFWSYEIKYTLQYAFFQKNSFEIPSYVLNRPSLLKSKLAWWWMDLVPSETIVVRRMNSKLSLWTHPHPQREK